MKEFAIFILGTAFLAVVISACGIIADYYRTQNQVELEIYKCSK